jgi:hypothetical protein
MREPAHMRTGQLVVRYYTPKRRRVLTIASVVGGLLLLYGMFELGRLRGGYDFVSALRGREAMTEQMTQLKEENAELRRQIASASLNQQVNRKAYADVEKNLAELQAQVLRQREELAFYRGIVSPEDGIGALRVQRFNVMAAPGENHYKLRLVLVQSMRQDGVVNGTVEMAVSGTRGGKPERLDLESLGAETYSEGRVAFSFRYFQNLEQQIALPLDFEPHSVEVAVRTGRNARIEETYPWAVQVES